jgi:membrane-bound serine protease (ClpP class)
MITSIFLGLYLLGLMSAKSAAVFLVICGVLMIASEFLFPSGIIAFGGVLALYIAFSLEYGQSQVFGVPIGWGIFFGIALVEGLILGSFVLLVMRYRKKKAISGAEVMIGNAAEVVEWAGTKGRVRVMGEVWKATSEMPLTLKTDDKVTVESIDNLVLKITA